MRKLLVIASASALALAGGTAAAQDFYISGSIGINGLDDSGNNGNLTDNLTVSGTGTDLDGATVPSGAPVGWETEFDSGYTYGAAVGQDLGAFRYEFELARASNDVDTHSDVSANGLALDGVDAAVLIEGQTEPLGATVGDIVADGQGDVSTTFLMVNGFYDFTTQSAWTPYVGGGIGFGFVDVDYSPSGVGIVDDDEQVFAYQLIGGVDYALNEQSSLFVQGRYRATEDVEVEVDLFQADLEIENTSYVGEVGYRYSF